MPARIVVRGGAMKTRTHRRLAVIALVLSLVALAVLVYGFTLGGLEMSPVALVAVLLVTSSLLAAAALTLTATRSN